MSVDELSTALIETLHISEGIKLDTNSARNKKKSDMLDFGVHLEGYQYQYKWIMEPEKWASCASICVSTTRNNVNGHPIALDEIIGDDIIDTVTDILLSKMSFLDAYKGNFRLNVGGFQSSDHFHGHFIFQLPAADVVHPFELSDPRAEVAAIIFEGATVAGSEVNFCYSPNPPMLEADMFEVSFIQESNGTTSTELLTIQRRSDGYVMDVPANTDKLILWWPHSSATNSFKNQLFKRVVVNADATTVPQFVIQSVSNTDLYLSHSSAATEGQVYLTRCEDKRQVYELVDHKYLAVVSALKPSLLLASTDAATVRPPKPPRTYFKQDISVLNTYCKDNYISLCPETMARFIAESSEVLLEHPFFPVFGVRSVKMFCSALSLTDLSQESTIEARRARLGCVMSTVRTLLALVRADQQQISRQQETATRGTGTGSRKGRQNGAFNKVKEKRLGFSVFFKLHDSSDYFLVPHFDSLSVQQLPEQWARASALLVVEPRFMYMYLMGKYGNRQAAEAWRAGYGTHGERFVV